MKKLIAELQYEDINLCMANGEEITDPDILLDLADCISQGDAEPACQHVLDHYEIDWRTVRCIRKEPLEFKNCEATEQEITNSAQSIYPDSATDFKDQDNAKLYLIWQAASHYENR